MAYYTPHVWWNVLTGVMGNGPYRHTWVNRTVAALFRRQCRPPDLDFESEVQRRLDPARASSPSVSYFRCEPHQHEINPIRSLRSWRQSDALGSAGSGCPVSRNVQERLKPPLLRLPRARPRVHGKLTRRIRVSTTNSVAPPRYALCRFVLSQNCVAVSCGPMSCHCPLFPP